jgi:dGTPase
MMTTYVAKHYLSRQSDLQQSPFLNVFQIIQPSICLAFFMPKLYQESDVQRRSGKPGVSDHDLGRSAYQKDYSRLLHAPSFRRLQGKTQLFPGAESDFFRNRLTHSLEVAQIATGIADVLNHHNPNLGIDRDLIQFAAIAHDLGHPPFGHNGEHVLDELMRANGGFEGNAQTLRILTQIERKLVKIGNDQSHDFGLDLTYRALASVLKYDNNITYNRDSKEELEKGYYASEGSIVTDIKAHVAPGYTGKFKTIECWIMDIADDIAYSTYDLEDSLHAEFVTPLSLLAELFDEDKEVKDEVARKTNKALIENNYNELGENELRNYAANLLNPAFGIRKEATGKSESEAAINSALDAIAVMRANQRISTNALARTLYTAERVGKLISQVTLIFNNDYPALSKVVLTRDALLHVEIFKHLNFELVIRSPKMAVVQYRGKEIVRSIFTALLESKGELLSNHWKDSYHTVSDAEKPRVVCDFVAGMTDRYAVDVYDALFGEGKGLYGPI